MKSRTRLIETLRSAIIKSLGDAAIEPLLKAAKNDEAITRRGWAIICLKEIGGPKAANAFDSLIGDPGTPHIVQTWAAAARVDDITHFEDLERYARLCGQYPALRRPLRIKLLEITAIRRTQPTLRVC